MDQKEVWNSIAQPWKTFRVKPLKEVVEFLKNKEGKILDLGCGTGRNFLKIKGIIYGVDFSEEMLEHAKKYSKKNKIKAEFVEASAASLPFKDNFFDSAIFIAALHCIPNAKERENSLKELLRVLKPNSKALITVWNYNQEKFKNSKRESFIPWKYDGNKYMRYYYLYDEKEFLSLLKKVGFEIIKIMDKENPSGLFSRKNIITIVKKPD
jgi:ubiquinone/menaquinone biosynthesis C-methylase UbiE|tara:strand:+ start:171 stop:800 length:630 start_codon:yes stop_codon:yes gene_type:complete